MTQVQVTVETAVRHLQEKIEPRNRLGEPTGEQLFAFQPKSFLVVGCLEQFQTDNGINTDKVRSFELYRRHTGRPEIITFDELYYRARFIVDHSGAE